MNYYIKVVDGQPFEHPIIEDNFRQAFPDIDTDNLPSSFAKFTRVEKPSSGPYRTYAGCTYEWSGEVITDVHHFNDITEEEKTTLQNSVKEYWAENGYPSWTFNEETCSFDPPVAYPDDGKNYLWDEETTSWVEITDD